MEFKKEFEIIPYGDASILVNFEQRINKNINAAVIELARMIESDKWIGVEYVQPAYCSLLIAYDGQKIQYNELVERINICLNNLSPAADEIENRLWEIPVCYESEFALDLADLSRQLKIGKEGIVEIHTSQKYRVYMVGFLPGFPYLGILSERLKSKRKEVPRKSVPAQSVGLAGMQTGIYPVDAPGGWQIIGKTPIKVFDANRSNPFLFSTGDDVQFYSITKTEYDSVKAEVTNGSFDYNSLNA